MDGGVVQVFHWNTLAACYYKRKSGVGRSSQPLRAIIAPARIILLNHLLFMYMYIYIFIYQVRSGDTGRYFLGCEISFLIEGVMWCFRTNTDSMDT